MKRLTIIFAALLLSSCGDFNEGAVDKFEKLEAPIILVSRDADNVLVVDCNNTYVIIPEGYYLAKSMASLNAGDTLAYFKKY
jgi:hypothetical protein